jgi:transcriptional regulator of acetoin/glycerol metabolism
MDLMMDYDWPGNVRQLQNVIQFAIVRSGGSIIRPSCLPMELRAGQLKQKRRGPDRKLDSDSVHAALEKTGGNKAKAAKLLEVGRATLYRFIKENPESVPESL